MKKPLDPNLLQTFEARLKEAPESLALHGQLGQYFLQQGHTDFASVQFHNVLKLQPGHVKAIFYLGVIAFSEEKWEAAKAYFEQVLTIAPEDVEAWVNLGALSLKEDKGSEAIAQFTKALLLNAEHEAARSNLAATFMHFDRYENALTHYLHLLEKKPETLEYLYNAAVCEMTLGQLNQAKIRFMRVLAVYPDHFETLYNLAVLAVRAREKPTAIEWLTRALVVNPKEPSARHLWAALTGSPISPDVAQHYASRLFDSYALYYEQHMLSSLQYQLPTILAATLAALPLEKHLSILDLGCGTGLAGEYLQPYADTLIGVDLSKAMLKRAEEKKCYTACIADEAVHYLLKTNTMFDVIVAVDVFPYLGDLKPCFDALAQRLKRGGYFIFSAEVSKTKGSVLQETSRYAHHPEDITALCAAAGLKLIVHTLKPARVQEGEVLQVGWYVGFLINA